MRPTSFFLALTAFVCLQNGAFAQQSYWNPTSTFGNWDTTSTIWGTTAGGPFNTVWTNGNTANLNRPNGENAPATLALTEAISAAGINFNGNFIVNSSGGSLTLANGATIAGATG